MIIPPEEGDTLLKREEWCEPCDDFTDQTCEHLGSAPAVDSVSFRRVTTEWRCKRHGGYAL